jgi:hypothetical protein
MRQCCWRPCLSQRKPAARELSVYVPAVGPRGRSRHPEGWRYGGKKLGLDSLPAFVYYVRPLPSGFPPRIGHRGQFSS